MSGTSVDFNSTVTHSLTATAAHKKRLAPLSLRLSANERQQLEAQAGGMALGAYIKSVVFDAAAPRYRKRHKPPVAKQQLLAEVLARLGETRHANNLNQIAKHLNQGTLIVDEELAADLHKAVAEVAWMRTTLLKALRGARIDRDDHDDDGGAP
ncbi:plasmid mobilization relaxosome protein MobC [uncultured Roseobacter sp.]|uniref:plasmid mobilization relaxosome protein MobC n=1 Tax=uncultured Roseobacter sp. TaxID=114847 RepID=UPI002629ACFA|nr:plasmid mobilization relaxosome protein MobC [uncultured Roseobacter sp.]